MTVVLDRYAVGSTQQEELPVNGIHQDIAAGLNIARNGLYCCWGFDNMNSLI